MMKVVAILFCIVLNTSVLAETPIEVASCLLEKWDDSNPNIEENIATVDECIQCFKEATPLTTEAGLNAAKDCVDTHLAKYQKVACGAELAAMRHDDPESGANAVACIQKWQAEALASYCLENSPSSDETEKLIDT